VEVPDKYIASADMSGLGDLWMEPSYRKEIQAIGDRWFEQQGSVALAVPSVVMPLQSNFLINPHHPDFKEPKKNVRILRLPVDRRLFEKNSNT
jgi:RES domain-containing protein